jgi:hypothetical protein
MKTARIYRMTLATKGYDTEAECVREHEMHFKVSRRGKITTIRRHLADRGVPYFQRRIYLETGKRIRKHRIRVAFEREEPAIKGQNMITIESRMMEYRGREWKAFPLPTRVLSYAKKRRQRRSA